MTLGQTTVTNAVNSVLCIKTIVDMTDVSVNTEIVQLLRDYP